MTAISAVSTAVIGVGEFSLLRISVPVTVIVFASSALESALPSCGRGAFPAASSEMPCCALGAAAAAWANAGWARHDAPRAMMLALPSKRAERAAVADNRRQTSVSSTERSEPERAHSCAFAIPLPPFFY
ncbi:MAG TPA: hypothetical protein VFS49_01500 [Croceibacterium sp.]|nr:hypothetical protein [Croceibacterium sp.]